MRRLQTAGLILTLWTVTGCATSAGVQERYLVCSYDVLWDATVETLKDRPVALKDKTTGVLETGWTEVPVSRTYGAFRRELADARDRTKVVATVKRMDDVTKVSFAETRERWRFRGGSRLFGWDKAEPSEEDMARLMQLLTTKLKERGCTLT